MIPGDLLGAFPYRQFHTLPGLLDSWAALPNSYPNACMPMQGGNLYHFYDGLWYDPAERRTHNLPCERRTRYWLSQPKHGMQLGATGILNYGLIEFSDHFLENKSWYIKDDCFIFVLTDTEYSHLLVFAVNEESECELFLLYFRFQKAFLLHRLVCPS